MGRNRKFDEDVVLQKAMQLFWRQGYEGTSVPDLEAHLGVGRRSLYNTFGNKRALYLKALARYGDMNSGWPAVECPIEAVHQMFRSVLADVDCANERVGCFYVNSGVEMAQKDADVAQISTEATINLTNKFQQLIEQAQASGAISAEKNSHALAEYLTNAFYGLRVMEKMNADDATLRSIIDTTLHVLT